MGRLHMFFYLALVSHVASGQRVSKRPSKETISKNDGRIIGGVEADSRKFAYVVSLQDSAKRPFCGGSIISPDWILTAAHCVDDGLPPSFVQVVAGTPNLKRETAETQRRQAVSIVIHGGYSSTTTDNDIALIKLQSPLRLGGNIRAVQLDHKEFSYPDYLFVAGWGRTVETLQGSSEVLKATATPGIPREECRRIFRNVNEITETMICSGFVDGGTNTCKGDSGGPAVSFDTGKQAGIVSWSVGCARAGYPTVYASVARFIPWLQRVTGLQL